MPNLNLQIIKLIVGKIFKLWQGHMLRVPCMSTMCSFKGIHSALHLKNVLFSRVYCRLKEGQGAKDYKRAQIFFYKTAVLPSQKSI